MEKVLLIKLPSRLTHLLGPNVLEERKKDLKKVKELERQFYE